MMLKEFAEFEEKICKEHLALMLAQTKDDSFAYFVNELIENGVSAKIIYNSLMKSAIKGINK